MSAQDAGGTHPPEREEIPLHAYALLAGIFSTCFVAPLLAAERRGALPDRLAVSDLALLSLGTFKLSRLVTRDAVTGFVRAPFVEFDGMESVTRTRERPRGEGVRRALGQLLLCPGCAGAWVASTLTAGFLTAGRPTRIACSTLSALAVSDFLHSAYVAVHQRPDP
jgi:Protein of unknown function (DUF1360)